MGAGDLAGRVAREQGDGVGDVLGLGDAALDRTLSKSGLRCAAPRRDRGGELITALIDEVFQLNGKLLRAGDALVAGFGLTSARWQVLGALGAEDLTVAQIARRRGLRRQSVQEVVTRLRADGLVTVRANPDDRRSPLLSLTPRADQVLAALQPEQTRWANQLGSAFSTDQLADAVQLLATLRAALDA